MDSIEAVRCLLVSLRTHTFDEKYVKSCCYNLPIAPFWWFLKSFRCFSLLFFEIVIVQTLWKIIAAELGCSEDPKNRHLVCFCVLFENTMFKFGLKIIWNQFITTFVPKMRPGRPAPYSPHTGPPAPKKIFLPPYELFFVPKNIKNVKKWWIFTLETSEMSLIAARGGGGITNVFFYSSHCNHS
jgi:hypothetical protein